MLGIATVLALLVGVSLGLLGGGGAILTTPILVYVLGMDAKSAIATSLLVVGTSSAVSAVMHARLGNVVAKIGLLVGVAGMVGGYAGGRLAGYVRGRVLLLAFAAMMIVTALAMVRGRKAREAGEVHPVAAIGLGVAIGLISGLVGAGGGFLIVPALVLFGGTPMKRAIGTSLMVIALQCAAGFVGHLGHAHIDVKITAAIVGAAVIGTFGGVALAKRLAADRIRKAFGWFVLAMGLFVLVKELR